MSTLSLRDLSSPGSVNITISNTNKTKVIFRTISSSQEGPQAAISDTPKTRTTSITTKRNARTTSPTEVASPQNSTLHLPRSAASTLTTTLPTNSARMADSRQGSTPNKTTTIITIRSERAIPKRRREHRLDIRLATSHHITLQDNSLTEVIKISTNEVERATREIITRADGGKAHRCKVILTSMR